jgi:heme/copper-type cytochrome/quinol oxidase subunit 1
VNMVASFFGGLRAGPDPWGAPSLEWAVASPPPWYNFAHLPAVSSRTPLWDIEGQMPVVHGLRVDDRELLLTTVISAAPDIREPSATPSIWPFVAAVATAITFISSVFSPWALVFGTIPIAVALAAWFWPKTPEPSPEPQIT